MRHSGFDDSSNGRDHDGIGLTPKQRDWLKHIRQCDEEGLTLQAYCTREGLGVKGMYAARKILIVKGRLPVKRAVPAPSAAATPPRFAAVRLSQPNAAVTIEALLPNQVQVRVSCHNASAATSLIESLARL